MHAVVALWFGLALVVSFASGADDLSVRLRIPNGQPTDGAHCIESEKQLLLKVVSDALVTQLSRSYYSLQPGVFCRNLCLPADKPGQFCTAMEKICNKSDSSDRRRLLQEVEVNEVQQEPPQPKKFRLLEELPLFMQEFFQMGGYNDDPFDFSFSSGDNTDDLTDFDANNVFGSSFDADTTAFGTTDQGGVDAFAGTSNGDPLLQQHCADIRDLVLQAVQEGTIGDLSPECELLVEQKFIYECFSAESLE